MEQEKSAYITSVHLKGYKSIRDVSVTLNKGLNILIGANGSGKTNFLAFLDAAYRSDYVKLFSGQTQKFESDIKGFPFSARMIGARIFKSDTRGIFYSVIKEFGDKEWPIKLVEYLDEKKRIVNSEHIDTSGPFTNIDKYSTLFIRFENILNDILEDKLSLNIWYSPNESTEKKEMLLTELEAHTVDSFLNDIFWSYEEPIPSIKTINDVIENIINSNYFSLEHLSKNLENFSPIKKLKFDWGLTRQNTDESHPHFVTIEGIDFKFFVNNEWINWTQLSDGTKRLFYLIGSVTYAKGNEIILIEEPELGVHPHQLALLMNFLKSQSRDKQIIISTHSPQVLNFLGEDELDRIIVARHEGKAGTKLYHLSEEEKGYASGYMKNEAFLSDYWMLSGFMNEENVANL